MTGVELTEPIAFMVAPGRSVCVGQLYRDRYRTPGGIRVLRVNRLAGIQLEDHPALCICRCTVIRRNRHGATVLEDTATHVTADKLTGPRFLRVRGARLWPIGCFQEEP